ncbi:hypothetical protein O181_023750 [Austropuccinia psidii MF-1]|uniref:Reverse transcriptase Ty1/copia-type domain-containing protein n=1 Tax=Austropuccinia psidii MF-1 TaxID=1389203 RepID=A0A9Q3CJP1_9BASI|nr:hypothetical protein [Austropuccinia psidii MF-1]
MVNPNSEGDIIWHKARIVVQGHCQIKGIEFEETFAPTPTFTSLRCIFAIASKLCWEVQTFDIMTAYLHSGLEESIYVCPPQGLAARQNKALYGLKQAGQCWWQHLQEILSSVGFESNMEDQSTYIYEKGNDRDLLWIHVDDGVLGASSMYLMNDLKVKLEERILRKWDIGIHRIVGIEV